MNFGLDTMEDTAISPSVESSPLREDAKLHQQQHQQQHRQHQHQHQHQHHLVTTRRSRPSSTLRLTPDAKRSRKVEEHITTTTTTPTTTTDTAATTTLTTNISMLDYPTNIPVPSKSTIATLYESALEICSDTTITTTTTTIANSNENYDENYNENNNENNKDQAYLQAAGVLSLEQVLLPALALQEERALKQIQAKVQRECKKQQQQRHQQQYDDSSLSSSSPLTLSSAQRNKYAVEACRRMVRQAVVHAIRAVQISRQERCQVQAQRRQRHAEARRLEREAIALALKQERQAQRQTQRQERRRVLAIQKQERQRQQSRQYPRNQALWKEVVFLTSSLTQLEKEERMWIQAEQEQEQLQQLQQQQDVKLVVDLEDVAASSDTTTPVTPTTTTINTTTTNKKHELQEQAEMSIQDMCLQSTRIQTGLARVLELLEESEVLGQQLYKTYRQDCQFKGYQGVRNPKAMIRFLSQED